MITNILVPTDFSPVANNALQFALSLAQKTGAHLHLLHIDTIPVTDAYFPSGAFSSYMAEIDTTTKENFEKLRNTFFKDTEIKFQSASVMGFGPDEIIFYAKEHNIDLIIMGTTGASGISEILFGSNAASVVSRSTVPVLVIPPSAQLHRFERIVYATDYNEPEFPSVSRLVYLAQLFDAEVTVLHALSGKDWYINAENNFFTKNKDHISFRNWKLIEINDNNVMDGINHFIEESHADLLVMAKHNRGFFQKIFHRSLSKRMAFHTTIPLLVLNEDEIKTEVATNEKVSDNLSTANS